MGKIIFLYEQLGNIAGYYNIIEDIIFIHVNETLPKAQKIYYKMVCMDYYSNNPNIKIKVFMLESSSTSTT